MITLAWKAPSPRRFSTPGRVEPDRRGNDHSANPTQPIPLSPGGKYTIYSISDGAMTVRQEITVATVLDDPVHNGATGSRHRLGTFRISKKRGEFHLDMNLAGTLVVPGWGHLQADHEAYRSFAGSATMNLAGTPEAVRGLVGRNINPNYWQHDRIIAYPQALDARLPNGGGILVFPDTPTDHAVITRMCEFLNQKEVR